MKILWLCPWLGNYRVPTFKELNRLTGGQFYLFYSKVETSESTQKTIEDHLPPENVVGFSKNKDLFIGKNITDFANSYMHIRFQPDLYKEIKRIDPDVIIDEGFGAWNPVGVWYAVRHGKKKLTFYERTIHVERNAPWYRTAYRILMSRFSHGFLINGELSRIYLDKVLKCKSKPKIEGIQVADSSGLAELCANFTKEEAQELKKEIGLKGTGLTYLFIGQLVERKGIRQLCKAWVDHHANFPEDNLLIIGKGIYHDELVRDYTEDMNVHIYGYIDYNDIHKYYAMSDVFVIPTLEDNWCVVVPEAMACKMPIACAVYNGGHLELVKDGENGYNFDPLNHKDMVQMLEKFHHADLEKMGEKSHEIQLEYTPEIAAKKIMDMCWICWGLK